LAVHAHVQSKTTSAAVLIMTCFKRVIDNYI